MKKVTNPHFICIGPTKTGTSWLHVALNSLPDVKMHPVKEMRFFWGFGDPRKRFVDVQPSRLEHLLGATSHQWRRRYVERAYKNYLNPDFKLSARMVYLDIKYLFFPQSINWYKSLFPKDKVSGDIDGHYVFFDQAVISKIKETLPEVKIILVLRNPIEKYWSQLRMWASVVRKVSLNGKTDIEILRRFRYIINFNPRYSDVIKLWSANFSKDQFYIAYYDDLVNDPITYLNGICNFLGIEGVDEDNLELKNVVFKGKPHSIPKSSELAAHDIFIPEVKKLVEMLDSEYPKEWLAKMIERNERLKSDEK